MEHKTQEQKEINLLLNKGFEVKVKILGFDKVFRCRKLSMGVMLELANIFIKMELDESALSSNDFQEQIAMQYQAVVKNAEKLAQVVAVCVAKNPVKRYLVKRAVMNQYTPKDIMEFAQNLLKESDYANFITSIALMNGNRPTKANPIEN